MRLPRSRPQLPRAAASCAFSVRAWEQDAGCRGATTTAMSLLSQRRRTLKLCALVDRRPSSPCRGRFAERQREQSHIACRMGTRVVQLSLSSVPRHRLLDPDVAALPLLCLLPRHNVSLLDLQHVVPWWNIIKRNSNARNRRGKKRLQLYLHTVFAPVSTACATDGCRIAVAKPL